MERLMYSRLSRRELLKLGVLLIADPQEIFQISSDDEPEQIEPSAREDEPRELTLLEITEKELLLARLERTEQAWEGVASFYSGAGCVGCQTDQRMANGDIFKESQKTLAFMRAPLNSFVLVTNKNNNMMAIAKVTDRGGFESYGRIADLSLGLKNYLDGNDLTAVNIVLLKQTEDRSI